jgi:hypothetical protein
VERTYELNCVTRHFEESFAFLWQSLPFIW